jgi:hypothetical protein
LGDAWAPIRKYWADPSAENRNALRPLFTFDTTKYVFFLFCLLFLFPHSKEEFILIFKLGGNIHTGLQTLHSWPPKHTSSTQHSSRVPEMTKSNSIYSWTTRITSSCTPPSRPISRNTNPPPSSPGVRMIPFSSLLAQKRSKLICRKHKFTFLKLDILRWKRILKKLARKSMNFSLHLTYIIVFFIITLNKYLF